VGAAAVGVLVDRTGDCKVRWTAIVSVGEQLAKTAIVMLGGAMGAVLRYRLAGLIQGVAGSRFAWGPLVVNVLGCFLAGLGWSVAEERAALSSNARLFLFIGLLAAFTTFSTYLLETGELIREGDVWLACVNVFVNTVAGLALILLGIGLGRLM